MEGFYRKWSHIAKKFYPSIPSILKTHPHILRSISPFQVQISSSALSKIKKVIPQLYLWSRNNSRSSTPHEFESCPVKNKSVLMGYDFHLDSKGQPKLIEINTNASGFLLVDLIEKTHKISSPALELLKQSFFEEWNLFSDQKKPHVAIIDSDIKNQKMSFEFIMYKDLIESWGWTCEIVEAKNIHFDKHFHLFSPSKKHIDFVYNRMTDFYFSNHPSFKKAFLKQTACFSPHPREYFLLADKRNLCLLSESSLFKEKMEGVILKTTPIQESLWSHKKNLFFKPFQGYGGKSSYRGQNITRKKFLELIGKGLAQEYVPTPKWIHPETQESWKFDIRTYAYKGEVQLIGGRIYKGQVTNFQMELSGFCQILT